MWIIDHTVQTEASSRELALELVGGGAGKLVPRNWPSWFDFDAAAASWRAPAAPWLQTCRSADPQLVSSHVAT